MARVLYWAGRNHQLFENNGMTKLLAGPRPNGGRGPPPPIGLRERLPLWVSRDSSAPRLDVIG